MNIEYYKLVLCCRALLDFVWLEKYIEVQVDFLWDTS